MTMVKLLKKKFIITAMTAVTVLLLLMLGAINLFNIVSVQTRNSELLDEVSEAYLKDNYYNDYGASFRDNNAIQDTSTKSKDDDSLKDYAADPADSADSAGEDTADSAGDSNESNGDENNGKPRPFSFMVRDINENDKLAALLFIVVFDRDGNFLAADLSKIATVTEEEAVDLAKEQLVLGNASGSTDSYLFSSSSDNNEDTIYFFLDITNDNNSIWRVVGLSALAGIACWGLLFLVVCALAHLSIKPIAINIEKQKNFITDAGHELKTPLAIIRANAEALELISSENKWTKNIKDQTDRLTHLTSNMLTLAKAEDKYSDLPLAEVNLSEIIRSQILLFNEPAVLKDLKILYNVADNIKVKGDNSYFSRMISLLLDNAVKYAQEGTEININVTYSDKCPVLRICNRCQDLPDCEPERLFDRFYRPDQSRNSATGGNGIGLSAARAIAELYGGKIKCEFAENNTVIFSIYFKI